MTVSTKGRYALRIMLDLAVYNTGEPVRVKDIAKRQDISEKYLEQIIAMLNKANYLTSVRGANGGYFLKRDPEEYTVGDILLVTEGSLTPVACITEDNCYKKEMCVTNMVWKKLDDAIRGVVDNITLGDMVKWHENMSLDYVI